MLATHNKDEKLSEDDPQTSYLISSWARMCKVMGTSRVHNLTFKIKLLKVSLMFIIFLL